ENLLKWCPAVPGAHAVPAGPIPAKTANEIPAAHVLRTVSPLGEIPIQETGKSGQEKCLTRPGDRVTVVDNSHRSGNAQRELFSGNDAWKVSYLPMRVINYGNPIYGARQALFLTRLPSFLDRDIP